MGVKQRLKELQDLALAHPYTTVDEMTRNLDRHHVVVESNDGRERWSFLLNVEALESEAIPMWHASGVRLDDNDVPIPLARLGVVEQYRLLARVRALLDGVGDAKVPEALVVQYASYNVRCPLSAADLNRLKKEA